MLIFRLYWVWTPVCRYNAIVGTLTLYNRNRIHVSWLVILICKTALWQFYIRFNEGKSNWTFFDCFVNNAPTRTLLRLIVDFCSTTHFSVEFCVFILLATLYEWIWTRRRSQSYMRKIFFPVNKVRKSFKYMYFAKYDIWLQNRSKM